MIDPRKVVIIGCGFVGAACAFALMQHGLYSEMVLIDANAARAEGEAEDIAHGLLFAKPMDIRAGSYADAADASLAIVTAGANQKPGETRLDLANKNIAIARDVTANIMKYYNGGAIMVVSNPVDVITYLIQKESGLPIGRVFGTGTVLDSARFRYFLSTKIDADIRNIHGYTAGEHGEAQFAVWSSVHVSGMRLDSFCEKKGILLDKDEVMRETISSGAQVIKRKGVTNYAIAAIVAELAATVLKNRRSIFSVTSLLDDYYGIGNVAISVPSFVGDEGVTGKLMYDFTQDEMENLHNTATKIRAFMDTLGI